MLKHIFALTLISSLRFFGLFIVLPIIGLYTEAFHTSAFLAGLAAGGYAITQIIFQTPFGIWSDRFERKHIVALGLVIFLLGSLVCAFADNILWLIIGRFLQGAGAIGSVVSAQIADLVREEERDKAMAFMGAGIFISFILAMLLSPIIVGHFGLNMLFFVISALCVLCLLVLYWKVPNTPTVRYEYTDSRLSVLLKNKNLFIMNLSAFLEKFLMIFAFVCISLGLKHEFGMKEGDYWQIYAPAALLGVLAMGPTSMLAQKKGQYKFVMLCGIFAFVLAYFLMAFTHSLIAFACGVIIFFMGFSIHEPIMQSLASRYPKSHQKGASLGIFMTCGYVGSALGGICGGWLYESIGLSLLSFIVSGICIIWALVLFMYLDNPQVHKNIYLPMEYYQMGDFTVLKEREGIIEYYFNQTQRTAIIKYDERYINKEQILSLMNSKSIKKE